MITFNNATKKTQPVHRQLRLHWLRLGQYVVQVMAHSFEVTISGMENYRNITIKQGISFTILSFQIQHRSNGPPGVSAPNRILGHKERL